MNFDTVVNKIKDVASTTGKKAGEVVEYSKLRLDKAALVGDIQKCYEKIGELTYNAYKTNSSNDEVIQIYLAEADTLFAKLSYVNTRIDEAKKLTRCPSCGKSNPQDAAYCSVCGSKLAEDDSKDDIAF